MSKRDFYRMDHEIRDRISTMFARGKGTKKHLDKKANNGKPDPEKIYMDSTADTYRACLRRFARSAARAGYKDMAHARNYTGKWLASRIAAGYSAWTIRTDAAALAKYYGCMTTELGVRLPARHQADVTQHRKPEAYQSRFSEARHPLLVAFCKSCGLRRSEILKLRPEDVCLGSDGRSIITVRQGKGGKRRVVHCLDNVPSCLAAAAVTTGRHCLFDHIPQAAPVHVYRAEFARAVYAEHARDLSQLKSREIYRCRGAFYGLAFDKKAIKEATLQLGHNRLGVTVLAYLVQISYEPCSSVSRISFPDQD